jgi:hypothetical protein
MGIPDFPQKLLLFNHLGNWKKWKFYKKLKNDNFVRVIMCHFLLTKELKK